MTDSIQPAGQQDDIVLRVENILETRYTDGRIITQINREWAPRPDQDRSISFALSRLSTLDALFIT